MNKKIKIVYLEPGEKPEIKMIDNSLESMQSIVGGLIQYVPMPNKNDIDIWCNEEGKLMKLKPNLLLIQKTSFGIYKDVIVGPVFFASSNENGKIVSLNDEQIKDVLDFCKLYSLEQSEEEDFVND